MPDLDPQSSHVLEQLFYGSGKGLVCEFSGEKQPEKEEQPLKDIPSYLKHPQPRRARRGSDFYRLTVRGSDQTAGNQPGV